MSELKREFEEFYQEQAWSWMIVGIVLASCMFVVDSLAK